MRDLGKFSDVGGDLFATQVSVAVVGTVMLGKGFDFYGHFGYNHVDFDNKSRFVTLDNSNFSGINLGLGFAYHFTPAIAGRIEFQQAATDLSNVGAGIIFSF